MVRKTIHIAIIAGGLALSFCFVSRSQAATASSTDPCPEPSDCLVPAPTIMMPTPGHQYADAVVITGLSWNETHVDVYIDGILHGRAELRQDPSEIGNFVYRPLPELSTGAHTLYTVARNLSDKERSFNSPRIDFTVIPLAVMPKPLQPFKPESTSAPAAGETEAGTSANAVINEFFKDAALSTSTATTTNQLLTLAGGLKVGIIIIAVIAAFVIYRLRVRRTPSQPSPGPDGPPEDLAPPGDFKPPSR